MSCEVISDPISNWALINAGILKLQLSLLNFVLSVALLYCFNLMSNWEDIWWWLANYKRATLYHALLYCLFYCKYARNLQNEHNALISEKWNYYWDNKLIRKVITEEQVNFFCAASLEKMVTSIYYMDDMYSNHNPDFDIFCMKLVKLEEACEYLLECTKKTMSRVPIIPKLLCALWKMSYRVNVSLHPRCH